MALFETRDDPATHDDKGPALYTVSILFTILAFITTVLRLCVRKKRQVLGWDDYAITAATVLTIVEAALTIQAVTHGKGKRGRHLSKAQLQYINMYSWYAQHVLFAAMALVKTSVCLLVVRIKPDKKLQIFVGIIISALFTSSFECSVVLLAQCRPISAHWRGAKPGQCWPTEVRIYSIYVQVGLSIITDLICSLLPIAIMWEMQMPRRKKLLIWSLMAMGLVCTACSVVRAKSLNSKSQDIAYEYAIVAIWAVTELNLGVIATNLALSRSLFYYLTQREQQRSASSKPRSFDSRSRAYFRSLEQSSARTSAREEVPRARSEDSDVPLKAVESSATEGDVR